jgi:hypothetical protein
MRVIAGQFPDALEATLMFNSAQRVFPTSVGSAARCRGRGTFTPARMREQGASESRKRLAHCLERERFELWRDPAFEPSLVPLARMLACATHAGARAIRCTASQTVIDLQGRPVAVRYPSSFNANAIAR